jgi:HEAT repeat protein
VPALTEALKDPASFVRGIAAWHLGDLGPVAKDAVEALIEALNDPDSKVRSYVRRNRTCGKNC